MYVALLTAVAILSFAPSAFAGTANVVNHCDSPVYFRVSAGSTATEVTQLPSSGYSESYRFNTSTSIKLGLDVGGSVTQFEYTWVDGRINYDISNIDGNPFGPFGTELTPSMLGARDYPTCQTVSCPAGQASCLAAYNQPNDVRTMVCPEDSDLTFTLCAEAAVKRSQAFHNHFRRARGRQLTHAASG